MSEWISVKNKLPEMQDQERTVDVILWFGSHCESGCFYFDEITGNPYHVFFDGDSLIEQQSHWMPLPEPPTE